MTTSTKLPGELIENLQDLIEINLDSAKGFSSAVDTVDDSALAEYFRQCSLDRQGFAEELQRQVKAGGVEPTESGSARGALHRWWLTARGKVQGGSTYAVLAEAERGEDAIKHAYEKVLKDSMPGPLREMLERQYVEVKAIHDQVRDLRDAHKEK